MSKRVPNWPTSPVKTSLSTIELTPDIDGDGVTLFIDGAESSHVNLTDPGELRFEYMQQIQLVLRTELASHSPSAPARGRPRVLHIGAAACSLARAINAEWPASHQVAVEVDAMLAASVREWFDLPRSPNLRIRVQDGLAAVSGSPDQRYEVVLRDAFAGYSVPAHLTTLDFVRHARRVLSPAGLYLANCADHPPLTLTRSEAATVREVFPHVSIVVEPGVLKGRRYGNAVIIGSEAPLDPALDRVLRTLPAPARLLRGAEVAQFIGAHPVITADRP